MSRDVDEDMIEATIRRVAASKAAGRAQQVADDAEPEPLASAAATDLIEATIRRVAASKAAGRAQEAADDDAKNPPAGVPELHVVPPAEQGEAAPTASAERPPVDESLIEATLRRIEAEQAARAAPASPGPDEVPAFVVSSTSETDIWATDAALEIPPAPPAPTESTARDTAWDNAARELRRDLESAQQQLRTLTERVEALFGGQAAPQPMRSTRSPEFATTPLSAADDWDDTPQLPRLPLGAPPRPAIVRDPSPRTATAAQLEYADPEPALAANTSPAATAEVATPAEGKRGFDLLPRTYRITVEDKRRGVDLVPLHRALLGMDGVRDMSLLSYSNGTAIVALETTNALDPDTLGKAVAHAMAREVKVEVHNEQTMVIKLAED